MEDFLLVFRNEFKTDAVHPSPEQLQNMMKPWQDWMGGLAAQNKLVNQGNRLAYEGKVLKPNNVVVNGPYVEVKEGIGGYTIIRAETLDEAVELAAGCPILHNGGNVEVRPIVSM